MSKSINWHSVAWRGLSLSKSVLLLFIFALIIHITVKVVPNPYHWYVAGIEFSVLGIFLFVNLRMSTYKPSYTYDVSKLLNKNPQLIQLLVSLFKDIRRFEEGSSYFFNSVRMYKYTTMSLSVVSTILLGLSFKEVPVPDIFKAIYPEVAKNIAFMIGTLITAYTAIMTFWNIEKYWLQNKTVANKLTALKDDIENLDKAGAITPEVIQQKFEAYQAVKHEFYKYWQGALSGKGAE
ncbi:MAG: hypothetical protein QM731_08365 [Chitinophagaceae bacterium]